MKLRNNIVRFLAALVAIAAPAAGFAAEEKMADAALMEPVKPVYDHYLAIQKELTRDSLKGVDQHASSMAKAVRGDEMRMLPPDVAKQADTLAKVTDLKAAREAFKPLSASLVKYLADNKAGKGIYHEAYCPMAKASWLQTEKQVRNPYYGKSMLDCGTLKN
jgi:Cu(I)/Ag(I) efflux system membrane fusion protein